MTNLQIFKFEENEIRTVLKDNEPWFIGKDVAKALGYSKTENAIAAHISVEDKTTTLIQGNGSNYKSKVVLINESGLYALIFGSKLEFAKSFKKWVTSEVLPSIRKTGSYGEPFSGYKYFTSNGSLFVVKPIDHLYEASGLIVDYHGNLIVGTLQLCYPTIETTTIRTDARHSTTYYLPTKELTPIGKIVGRVELPDIDLTAYEASPNYIKGIRSEPKSFTLIKEERVDYNVLCETQEILAELVKVKEELIKLKRKELKQLKKRITG